MKFFVVGVDVEDVRLRIVNGRLRMVLVDPTIALLTGVEIVADVTCVYLSVDLLNRCYASAKEDIRKDAMGGTKDQV